MWEEVTWWIAGTVLFWLPAEDLWAKWKAGKSYRYLKKHHYGDPLAGAMVRYVSHHFRPEPGKWLMMGVGLFILSCQAWSTLQ